MLSEACVLCVIVSSSVVAPPMGPGRHSSREVKVAHASLPVTVATLSVLVGSLVVPCHINCPPLYCWEVCKLSIVCGCE